jgi:hypothetical protein
LYEFDIRDFWESELLINVSDFGTLPNLKVGGGVKVGLNPWMVLPPAIEDFAATSLRKTNDVSNE